MLDLINNRANINISVVLIYIICGLYLTGKYIQFM